MTNPFESPRAVDPDATPDHRTYAGFIHLASLANLALPLAGVIAPLIMWLVKRDQSPFIDDHGKEAVNFQITLLLYSLAVTVAGFITCGLGFFLGFLPLALWILGLIQATMAANRGEFYRYPMTLRLIPTAPARA